MKSLLKKAVPFVLVLSSVAVAATLVSKDIVNAKIAAVIAPYNNDTTKMVIGFTDLNVDSVRALDLGVFASVWKKGTENELTFKVSNVSYHYGNGQNPTATGAISMNLDLVKAFGQPFLNQASDEMNQLIQQIASTYTQEFGAAVTIQSSVDELKKDANGDVVSAKVSVSGVFDLSKLPASIKPEDVQLKSFQATILANRGGLGGSIQVVLNPANKAFQEGQPGMKEDIDKLLNGDEATYQSIKELADSLNQMADSIVNKKAQQ